MTVADEPAQAPPSPVPAPAEAPDPAGLPAAVGTDVGTDAAAPVTGVAPAGAAEDRRRLRLAHLPELDGIRGLSVLAVVLYHLGVLMWPGKPSWFFPTQFGVDVFFVLSGFLITALLLGEHGRTGRVRVGNFLWRRFLRLVPALVAFMAGLLVAAAVTDRYTPREVLTSAARVLTFATNLDVERVIVEVGHTWSLSVEAHFYLVWCLVTAAVVAVARRPYPVLACLAGAGIATSAVLRALAFADDGGATAFHVYVHSLYRMDAPLMGALAGIAWVAGWFDRVPPRLAAWATALSLAALGAVTLSASPLSPALFRGAYTVVAATGAVLVVGAQLSGRSAVRRILGTRPLVLVGTVSYSVYLWHLPLMMYLDRNARSWPLGQRMLVALGGTAVLAAASYYVIERPFLRRKARERA